MTAIAYSPTTFRAPRLVRAELLKLRKRRGLVAVVGLLTVGATLLASGILAGLHAFNPAHHGPAGGVDNLGGTISVLSLLVAVAATLVGAAAGSDDVTSGVFRELVATGRSRWSLFLARIPGGLAFLLAFVGVAYAVAAISSVVFAGSLAAPGTTVLVEGGLLVLAEAAFSFAVALGLASLVGSRATIGIMLAFRLALTPLFVSISALGIARAAIPGADFARLAPHALGKQQLGTVSMSATAAIAALMIWTLVALAAGARRTMTRDA